MACPVVMLFLLDTVLRRLGAQRRKTRCKKLSEIPKANYTITLLPLPIR